MHVDIKIMFVQGAHIDMKQEVDIDLLVSPLTRALFFDSPGKSDISVVSTVSSELAYEGNLKSPDEDKHLCLFVGPFGPMQAPTTMMKMPTVNRTWTGRD